MIIFILTAFIWILFFFKAIISTILGFLWDFKIIYKVYVEEKDFFFAFNFEDTSDAYTKKIEYKSAWHALFNIK